jgi:1-acyl-sn-glycerol-3-phosphate acyltransferase
MAKKELFTIPVLGWLLKGLGAFPVDRSGSDVGAIKTAISLVGEGGCLGIFPQGHRYPETDPRETSVKNGAAMIAAKNGADIVPAYLWTKKKKKTLSSKITNGVEQYINGHLIMKIWE